MNTATYQMDEGFKVGDIEPMPQLLHLYQFFQLLYFEEFEKILTTTGRFFDPSNLEVSTASCFAVALNSYSQQANGQRIWLSSNSKQPPRKSPHPPKIRGRTWDLHGSPREKTMTRAMLRSFNNYYYSSSEPVAVENL